MAGRLWGGGPIKRIFIDPLWRPWHLLVLWAWPLRVWPLYVRHSILRYWGGNNVIYILTIDPGSRKKIKMDCLRVCTYFFWYLIESKQMKIRFDGHPKQRKHVCHYVVLKMLFLNAIHAQIPKLGSIKFEYQWYINYRISILITKEFNQWEPMCQIVISSWDYCNILSHQIWGGGLMMGICYITDYQNANPSCNTQRSYNTPWQLSMFWLSSF